MKLNNYTNFNLYKNGSIVSFCLGLLIILGFYRPFEQPVLWDRAYLLYMSQVVARGEPLYNATTFGYTPLSVLIVGFFMWVGKLFSISTLVSAKIVGIFLYGLICAQFFRLVSVVFTKKKTVFLACIFFLGLGYFPLLSGVNAEPKLWVLFFTILGMKSVINKEWLFAGLYFSLSSMCWHASVISLFPCLILIPWKNTGFLKSGLNFIAGIFLGTLPVFFYLFITKSWENFWVQAVLRKLVVEGNTVGESPFTWFYRGLYPMFIPEILHFILAFLGFVALLYFLITQNASLKFFFKKRDCLNFFIGYTIIWVIFNSLEFQSPVDLFPLIPALIIIATFFIQLILPEKNSVLLMILILGYNFYDAIIYDLPYKLSKQIQQSKEIRDKYGKALLIRFEEINTVLEEPLPTRFMRYSPYEDHLIKREPGGCEAISRKLISKNFQVLIELDWKNRKRSKYAQLIVKSMQELLNKNDEGKPRGKCASQLIETLTNQKPVGHFTMNIQSIPIGKLFYTEECYTIYNIE